MPTDSIKKKVDFYLTEVTSKQRIVHMIWLDEGEQQIHQLQKRTEKANICNDKDK